MFVLSGLGIVKHTRFPFARASTLNKALSSVLQELNELAAETLRLSPLEDLVDLLTFLPKSLVPFYLKYDV